MSWDGRMPTVATGDGPPGSAWLGVWEDDERPAGTPAGPSNEAVSTSNGADARQEESA